MTRILRRYSALNACPVCHDRDCPGCSDWGDDWTDADDPAEPVEAEPDDDDGGDDARAEDAWESWRERLRDERYA